MVDYNGVATTTEHGGELRQERVRHCGLPSWNSGQWGTSGVAGVTVVLLRWRRSSEDELSSAMAPAALGAGMAAAAGEEEGRGNEKRSAEGVRRALAVLKPRGAGRWQRAASHDVHAVALPWRRSATEPEFSSFS